MQPAVPSPNAGTNPRSYGPAWWEVLTWGCLGVVVVYALGLAGQVVALGYDAALLRGFARDPGSFRAPAVPADTVLGLLVSAALLLVGLGFVGIYIVWRFTSLRMLRDRHPDPAGLLRHWTRSVWLYVLGVSILIAVLGPDGRISSHDLGAAAFGGLSQDDYEMAVISAGLRHDYFAMVATALRILAIVLAAIGIWKTRPDIRVAYSSPMLDPVTRF